MADLFVAYSSNDRVAAEKLIRLLEAQWSVWWDDLIVGDFDSAIETEVPRAKCLIVLWSPTARESNEVKDEVRLARDHDIPVIAVKLAACSPPYGMMGLSFVDMLGWSGDGLDQGYLQLLRKITTVVTPRRSPIRPRAILDTRVELPALFLSVSSHETQLTPGYAVEALKTHQAPLILVSAYDAVGSRRDERMLAELADYRERGGFVLIDSGNYEATRLKDETWSPEKFAEALADMPHDCAFCFDALDPPKDTERAADAVIAAVERDGVHASGPMLPIVHARRFPKGGFDLPGLAKVICKVAEQLTPAMIAIPERELGAGLLERARSMMKLRSALSKLPFYQPIHLLGTGNPWSIALLATAGADSFDGLEWCRVAVDHDSGRLHHYQHFDFFRYQAELSDSPLTREALNMRSVTYPAKVAFHNLDYYGGLARKLIAAAAKGDFEALVVGMLGAANIRQVKKTLPELLL
ncbi:TIR domain-containing protein [Sphingopyxis terrae]|uniref:Queuine/archaeosine tRNA-ribosyltransferase n=1 Tax=Sphingopyxis terrae subsp. ummariensis TaxID=429001 RepID=A0A1Y6FSY7_9SPHN|nr:TIR domain-containing protein [Sphingopyxis terrae]PCF91067.1 TIR domain-containing protein [Sphingopyxis terrae subsp. ummariensis]SMQ76300.1 Queuine/archaeosine tRNA-ribosyltransferase [Sphingopyxis terrae subsp. ummariensis]